MFIKLVAKTAFTSVIVICFLLPLQVFSQNSFENAWMKEIIALSDSGVIADEAVYYPLYPNDAPTGVMTPSGWGGYGTYLFGYIGGAWPEVYRSSKADLITAGGFCIGNPEKFVNVAASLNMTDVHNFTDFSGNLSISRSIFKGSSITIGGLQLFANSRVSDAPEGTYYVAFSHSVQTLKSKTPGCSKLTYTIGVGNGRFLSKSIKDIETGKGKNGTGIFGGLSYELLQHLNINGEWDGMNLGFSLGWSPFKFPFSIGIGGTNLTRYSADKPNMVFALGYPLSLNKRKS